MNLALTRASLIALLIGFATLFSVQYYKVDDSGKVHRLRKECPVPECGPGTFMANHFDRHYCGKCGLTYVYQKKGEEAS